MQTISLKNKILTVIFSTVFILGSFLFLFSKVHANPSEFPAQVSTSSASSSPIYMTAVAGTNSVATTTIVLDSYVNGNNYVTNSASLAIQMNASSSANTTLGWRYEYAPDQGNGLNCKTTPGACDWYSDNLVNSVASTTAFLDASPNSHSWAYASSTSMCDYTVSISTNTRGCKAVLVPTPMRYVRVVFYDTGSAGLALYATLVPIKEVK